MQIWDDREPNLLLVLTPDEFDSLPDGILIRNIGGERKFKDGSEDTDTRFGHIAWGLPVAMREDK